MAETIFTKILAGEIPCHKIYEDDLVLAFLDIGPLSEGHTLVIPKEPAETLDKLSAESSAAIGRVLPALCRAVLKATGATYFNVIQNNGRPAHQYVDHVHFHVIPKFGESGLGITWDSAELDHEKAAGLARRIAGAVDLDG